MYLMSVKGFKYFVEGLLVPLVSSFGLLGNTLTVLVLSEREVKLKRSLVQLLTGLAAFDNAFLVCALFMFTLPQLDQSYRSEWLPYIAPYLLPATNTLMTCSVYATVAVAVQRCVETWSANTRMPYMLESGRRQCALVLLFSIVFNFSRWFELRVIDVNKLTNITVDIDDQNFMLVLNVTNAKVAPTALRVSESYIRWYSMGINCVVMNVIPTLVLVFCSFLIYRRLKLPPSLQSNDERRSARHRRNQSISRALIIIIVLFVVCHTGKSVISVYELVWVALNSGVSAEFAPWARYLIVTNTLLVVINSSINFVVYCGDVVFRECLAAVSRRGLTFARDNHDATIIHCSNHNETRVVERKLEEDEEPVVAETKFVT